MDTQVNATSPDTTLFRASDLKSPTRWVEKPVPPAAASQYGETTAKALGRQQWLGALRLPGRAEYLAALDDAVADVLHGRRKPRWTPCCGADAKWRKITERLGLEKQKTAYRHALGLD